TSGTSPWNVSCATPRSPRSTKGPIRSSGSSSPAATWTWRLDRERWGAGLDTRARGPARALGWAQAQVPRRERGWMSTVRSGLEGVMATSSAVSFIDGDRSLLTYRGYSATDLAQQSTFEETAYLLLDGELPTRAQLEAFVAQLEAARPVPQPVLDRLAALPQADPMALLRTGVSLLAHFDPDRSASGSAWWPRCPPWWPPSAGW